MPIPVSIYLMNDTSEIAIRDHYRNDKLLYKEDKIHNRNSTIDLPKPVATDNCSYPELGRLLIKAKVREAPGKPWRTLDEPFDVTAGQNAWPRTPGLIALIQMLLAPAVAPLPGGGGAALAAPQPATGGGAAKDKAKASRT